MIKQIVEVACIHDSIIMKISIRKFSAEQNTGENMFIKFINILLFYGQ